jgi:hypothetical protein
MASVNCQYQAGIILDPCDYSVIANAITPITA